MGDLRFMTGEASITNRESEGAEASDLRVQLQDRCGLALGGWGDEKGACRNEVSSLAFEA